MYITSMKQDVVQKNARYPEELNEMKAQMSEDQYAQELECSFEAAVLGTYYASIINMIEQKGQVNDTVTFDAAFPVFVASDLGFTDSCAWWFWQVRPDGLAIIDHYEEDSKPLTHYFDMLLSKPYTYETIYLPHDARAKTLQTGRSTIEQFLDPTRLDSKYRKGMFPVEITPQLKVQHGIDAARLILPDCHFNKTKTEFGIEALRAYRRTYDKEHRQFSNTPLHDWASDSSDAFRYLALVAQNQYKPSHNVPAGQQIQPKLTYPPLNQMFKDHEQSIKPRRALERLRT